MSDDPQQGNLQLQSPGEILREEREKRNQTIDEIAQLLNLKPELIESIEADDYQSHAAPTYTRGYLRSYAKLVDVDANSLIELFDNTYVQESTPEIQPKVTGQTQISSNDKPVKLVTYLISLGLVLLVLIWWQGNFDMSSLQNLVSDKQETPAVNQGFDYEYTIVTHPDDPNYRADTRPEDYQAELPQEMPVESDLMGVADEPTVMTTDTDAENVETSAPVEQQANNETATGNTSQDDLTLLVKAESWIEVYDASKKRLYLDLAKPGSIIQLGGLKPYSLLIGNANAVKIQFQGKDYDLTPHINSGVARLKLGE